MSDFIDGSCTSKSRAFITEEYIFPMLKTKQSCSEGTGLIINEGAWSGRSCGINEICARCETKFYNTM